MSFPRPSGAVPGAQSSAPLSPRTSLTPGRSSLRSPGSSSPQKGRPVFMGSNGLPPPPPGVAMSSTTSHRSGSGSSYKMNASMSSSSYPQHMAKSMTIEEMRQLHHRALSQAEAKRTELRLVLASRYRELVGSSDEVIRMKERAQELHDLVRALPGLLEKVSSSSKKISSDEEEAKFDGHRDEDLSPEEVERRNVIALRRKLSSLPRLIHRVLDVNDVYKGTTKLIELFTVIASQTNEYKLATALSTGAAATTITTRMCIDPALDVQMRMVFLQMQTLPMKIIRTSKKTLLKSASYGKTVQDPVMGAEVSASALASLHLLNVEHKKEGRAADDATHLLDLYFDYKAKLLMMLLNKLGTGDDASSSKQQEDGPSHPVGTSAAASNGASCINQHAETILSKIVLLLQYDILLHPYQVFVLRKFPWKANESSEIMSHLPTFASPAVKGRCSKFLAVHLPMIRTKVKTVLDKIAGTTASALGQIRQSLYDKTDGNECMERLNNNGICSWDDAVANMVDVRNVLSQVGGATGDVHTSSSMGGLAADLQRHQRFSLWSALFSNTFSSLVHSLLTSAFSSVHAEVVAKLKSSLANAPPLAAIMPHEAYRNTLTLATDLNRALLKVSEDAHELLVHAEEREESERRLRQSLYVQTCEIMGRLVCELRRMVSSPTVGTHSDKGHSRAADATKELIVGRLCYLLKFRLTSLPTLLDSNSSPSALHTNTTTGMISFIDLQSAFELADDNEDGLITFEEAMEAVESAFSGTRFRGAEMMRETLLLSSARHGVDTQHGKNKSSKGDGTSSFSSVAASNVTLTELTLLTARGLRHETSGPGSALGTVQQALDDIVERCFTEWSKAALRESTEIFRASHADFWNATCSVSNTEWQRLYPGEENNPSVTLARPGDLAVPFVSPYIVCHILDVSSILNRTTCPSDSLPPVPSVEYASSLGIAVETQNTKESIATLADNLRWSLLKESLASVVSTSEDILISLSSSQMNVDNGAACALAQYQLDFGFLKHTFFTRNRYGFGGHDDTTTRHAMEERLSAIGAILIRKCDKICLERALASFTEKYNHVYEVSDLSFSSLFGESAASVSAVGELDLGVGKIKSATLFSTPLPSSRRFNLLPVQADRSLSEIQLRGSKYAKEKEASSTSRPEALGPSVVSSGLGFLSSMLKKT